MSRRNGTRPFDAISGVVTASLMQSPTRIVLPPAGTSRLVPLRPKAAEKPAAGAATKNGDPADKAPTGDPAINGQEEKKPEKKPDALDLNKPAGQEDEPQDAGKRAR